MEMEKGMATRGSSVAAMIHDGGVRWTTELRFGVKFN